MEKKTAGQRAPSAREEEPGRRDGERLLSLRKSAAEEKRKADPAAFAENHLQEQTPGKATSPYRRRPLEATTIPRSPRRPAAERVAALTASSTGVPRGAQCACADGSPSTPLETTIPGVLRGSGGVDG